MQLQALVCCRCGGPLANPESLPALLDCLYCGTTNSASSNAISEVRDGIDFDVRRKAIAKFTEALVAALKSGQPPLEALRSSSAAHLGVAGRADTVARIALALAQDFERESGASAVRDAMVLSRIANAYLLALDELRTSDTYDLNLPFLTATSNGPVHLQRTLTSKLLAELAVRDTSHPDQARTGVPAEKKKGWWPF